IPASYHNSIPYTTLFRSAWDPKTPASEIGHIERVYYWGEKDNSRKLEFLIAGEEKEVVTASWENDTEEEHLARIINWCREKGYRSEEHTSELQSRGHLVC